MKGTKITIESGEGLLDARALWASIVGPYRLALAQKTPVTLKLNAGTLVAENIGQAEAYIFVGITLPQGADPDPLAVIFGDSDQLGKATNLPAKLTASVGENPYGFMQLLQPGEQLFCQIANPAVNEQKVVVSQVTF